LFVLGRSFIVENFHRIGKYVVGVEDGVVKIGKKDYCFFGKVSENIQRGR
jgi:hypothetical protein